MNLLLLPLPFSSLPPQYIPGSPHLPLNFPHSPHHTRPVFVYPPLLRLSALHLLFVLCLSWPARELAAAKAQVSAAATEGGGGKKDRIFMVRQGGGLLRG